MTGLTWHFSVLRACVCVCVWPQDCSLGEFLEDQDLQRRPDSDPRDYKKQEAIWELFTSECVYFLDQLMVLKEVTDSHQNTHPHNLSLSFPPTHPPHLVTHRPALTPPPQTHYETGLASLQPNTTHNTTYDTTCLYIQRLKTKGGCVFRQRPIEPQPLEIQ